MTSAPATENLRIAARLRETGERLGERGANPFAAAAFDRAADSVERWPCALRETYERRGETGLRQLPGVGRAIARAIAGILADGRVLRPERSFLYTGDDGMEHECVVIDRHRRPAVSGRDAIVELLRRDRHNGRA